MTWGSSVGTVTGCGLDNQGSGVQFLAGAGNSYVLHCVHTISGAHQASCPMGTRGSFLGVKQPDCEADHMPSSSAEVKNAWHFTSIP
jgi:hypothetical protein